jgi:hypothetical protein
MRMPGPVRNQVLGQNLPIDTGRYRLTADIGYGPELQKATGQVFEYRTSYSDFPGIDPPSEEPLDWPVIVTDGLDHRNYRGWNWNYDPADEPSLYQLLNQSGLLEEGKKAGLDFFVLNFDQSAGYIQSNAFLLVKLIQHINSLNPQNEIVIVGPSMGGVVSRYALTYMEANDIPHNTRLFISYDAPQQGANIPLGLQWWVWFFSQKHSGLTFWKGGYPDPRVVDNLELLNSPAPRQLLVYYHGIQFKQQCIPP